MEKNSTMKIKMFSIFILTIISCSYALPTKKKIIFFGDSITEQGVKPDGFITKMKETLDKKNLGNNYQLIGAGVSSNKVYDLYLRMEEDVIAQHPDAIVIWIGVNDVWHKKILGTGTDADKFERFYMAIIKKLKERNIAVYLCTPAAIGEKTDFTNEMDGDLNKYAAIIRSIAQKTSCTLIDLRKNFLDYLQKNNPDNKDRGLLTTDGVHLNEAGNIFVAGKIYDILSKDFIKS